ncbi:MAG: ABC transporter ATP-binding protein [Bacteroides sp.]|nr:ABC transporter ATP-binding protein [Bacillota bacterium]MCM1394037.1 ABC transporter ATP-binding protein [[Eubacterium] siraeum]MCM1455879.1 ABC transporter ATP-binding protein [Bacteroides sp.]
MFKISNLTKTYAGSKKPSVENLSLEVGDGEIFGFIGPNGAGKSTTIKCITSIINFEEGNISVDGISLKDNPCEVKKLVGYVSDDHVLYEGLTGIEYVNFICDVFDVPSALREERLNRYLEMFALEGAIKNQISSYSHGMKQKLNIIGALIHEPRVWILDEPMTGLDPKSAYHLKTLMREHADKGNCVFFSSHVLEVVEKICDRIGIIDNGKLITTCTISELKERDRDSSLEELFLKLTEDTASENL